MLRYWPALRQPVCAGTLPAIGQQALGVWAMQFSPRVTCCEEGVLLEVMASARLLGGLEALRRRVGSGAAQPGGESGAPPPRGGPACRSPPCPRPHATNPRGHASAATSWAPCASCPVEA